jgi:hypothetical protein
MFSWPWYLVKYRENFTFTYNVKIHEYNIDIEKQQHSSSLCGGGGDDTNNNNNNEGLGKYGTTIV